jgi:carboxylate-amine ligase
MPDVRKVGVEEELLLVDPASGALVNTSRQVLHEDDHDLEGELLLHMVETQTEPDHDLSAIGEQLRQSRRTTIEAADRAGAAVAAVGMAPVVDAEPEPSKGERYQHIVNEYADTGRTAETLGMHVHVDVADDEEAVRVVDGIRDWLPLLVAV